MSVVVERPAAVSGLEWTVLRGDREQVFRALGEVHAADIARVRERQDGMWQSLVHRAEGTAHDRFAKVVASSARLLPVEAQEIEWMAAGAGIAATELWAMNLRGDLGRDGLGCSDLAVAVDGGVVMGHNEDGGDELRGDVRLVTLDIDGDPTVTAVWYPGMLPANAFVTTSAGLSFGMDHVSVAVADLGGAGRHLVARHAQRRRDGDAARAALTGVACAGGFAFDVADAAGRVDLVENAAGRVATAGGGFGPLRHTNHLCLDDLAGSLGADPDGAGLAESRGRLAALTAACRSPAGPGDVFGALRAPGVLNRAEDLWTYATIVVDTAADTVMLQASAEIWTGRLSAFARGERVDA
ncbi:C45 family peptidase [Microbacterium pullorum]|uniref:C45 family peptidase n=1 Tax=Microbacterium pullorum TaxID=2762236 RepID=UPI00296A9CE6|nr:C45 family peptidase [Microbacterium pullorum]